MDCLTVDVLNMSLELDNAQEPRHKKHKRSKEKGVEISDRKRKRQASEGLEPTSPTKKHRSKDRSLATKEDEAAISNTPPSAGLPIYQQSSSLYLPLPPISQNHALRGLCAEHLSPLILTYYPPFHGVILSYSNARLSTNPQSDTKPAFSRAIDEYAASFIWLTADFIVVKPRRGDTIEGWVNLQNESNIGLLCLNFFNVTIERKRLAKEWKWITAGIKAPPRTKLNKSAKTSSGESEMEEDPGEAAAAGSLETSHGYFQDEDEKKVGGLLRFRVKGVQTSRSVDRETGFLSIEGTMLSQEDEKKLYEQECEAMRKARKRGGHREGIFAMKEASAAGFEGVVDVDINADLAPSLKHRAKY